MILISVPVCLCACVRAAALIIVEKAHALFTIEECSQETHGAGYGNPGDSWGKPASCWHHHGVEHTQRPERHLPKGHCPARSGSSHLAAARLLPRRPG